MFHKAQQYRQYPAVRRANGSNHGKARNAVSILPLLSGVTISVFIAGIVVPSLIRSGMATNHDLAAGSLHTLTIGGVVLSYTLKNLGFAVLGALFGSLLALAIEFDTRPPRQLGISLRFRRRTGSHANPVV
jgi:hypothetical protein